MRADTGPHQDGARCSLCYIFLSSYHFTDGWCRGWCDEALDPSGHALFSPVLISQGNRSTTPKWCVGVCSGLARVWVTGSAHPRRHDTAQNNRLSGMPAEAVRIVCDMECVAVCVGGWECVKMSQDLVLCVQSCLQCSTPAFFQESVLFMLRISTPPKAVC